MRAAARIARVVKVLVSVDIENGYSDDPRAAADLVLRLVDAGSAGINVEDGRDPPQMLAAKLEVIRNALAKHGMDIFVNARTDVVLSSLVAADLQVAETIRRGDLYASAGADGLFVPGLRRPAAIESVVAGLTLPLIVMAWGGLPGATQLGELGVKRLSAGSAIPQIAWRAAQDAARSFLRNGDSDILMENLEVLRRRAEPVWLVLEVFA